MSTPDPDAILNESPIHSEGRRLGEEIGAAFSVADHAFFRKIAAWRPLAPVLAGEVGEAVRTADALIGLGEGCANGGLLLAFGAHCFAVAGCISRFAAGKTAKSVLSGLSSGASIAALAASEADAGSDVMALRTSYAETADGYVLRGEKTYIANAVNADLFLVFATKDARLHSRGIAGFIVERAAPGLVVAPIPVNGAAGASLGKVTLRNVEVGKDSLVGRLNGGAQVFRHAMIQERVLLSAFLVGAMRRALTHSAEFAKSRHQFGLPIAANQFVSGRIVEMLRRYATARLLVHYATERLERGVISEAEASLTKLHASESAVECQMDALRIQGAKGLETAGGTPAELLDALSSLTYSGTSDLQRVILAASLGLPT